MKIGFYNNKGGVGKTTTVINLAYIFAKTKQKILVVDCDTQKNSYDFFKLATPPKTEDLFEKHFENSRYENIYLELWETYYDNPETVNIFDIEIFDLPPKMDDETREILNQCDWIFVPMEVSKLSVSGLAKVQEEIKNSNAKFGGAFFCRCDKSSQGVKDMLEYTQKNFSSGLLKTIIPESFAIKNSLNYDLTAAEYMNNSSAIKYCDLAEEILEKIQKGDNNNG